MEYHPVYAAALNSSSSGTLSGQRLNMMIHWGGMSEPSGLIYRWTGVGQRGGGGGGFSCTSSCSSDKIKLFPPNSHGFLWYSMTVSWETFNLTYQMFSPWDIFTNQILPSFDSTHFQSWQLQYGFKRSLKVRSTNCPIYSNVKWGCIYRFTFQYCNYHFNTLHC